MKLKHFLSELWDHIKLLLPPILVAVLFLSSTNTERRPIATSAGQAGIARPASVYVADGNPVESISDWAVGTDYIYVYYDSLNRVDAFGIDGDYSFSIQLPAYKSGVGGVGVEDSLLYVMDKDEDVHIFDGINYIECIPDGAEPGIDVSQLRGKEGYRLLLGHIIEEENGNVLLDLRKSSIYLNYGKYTLILIPFIILGITANKGAKRNKKNNSLLERIDPVTGKVTQIRDEHSDGHRLY